MFAVLSVLATAAPPTVSLVNGVLSPIEMPVIAAGTGEFAGANATVAVASALSSGFTHVHTAFDYYNLKEVGAGLKSAPRSSFFLSSMTSPCIHPASPPKRNVTDPDACYNLTLQEAESVMSDLAVDSLDLLMLHGPSETFGHVGGCSPLACKLARAQWKAYQTLLHSKRVGAIGVSNFCISCLACLGSDGAAATPAVNQIQVHVGQGSSDPGGLLSYCAARGIAVQGYQPLAGGALVTDSFCAAIGDKYQKSAAQVALKWVLQRAPALVVGAGSAAHDASDLDLFDFQLDGSDLEGLDAKVGPPGEAGGRCSWGCTE